MSQIEKLSINLVNRLTSKRLKSLKKSLYGMLASVQYKCECGCNEIRVVNPDGLDILKENIKMVSIRQMEMGK